MTEDRQRAYRLRFLRLSAVTEEDHVSSTVDVPEHGQSMVGRGKEAQVKLHSPRHPTMISRRHAILRADGSSLFLTDLESTNGVFVNGQKIPANVDHRLHPGDTVVFGVLDPPGGTDFKFRVVATDSRSTLSTQPSALCSSLDSISPMQRLEPRAKRLCMANDELSEVAHLRIELARMQRRLAAMEDKTGQTAADISAAVVQLQNEKKAMEQQLRAELEKETVQEAERREQEIIAEAQRRKEELQQERVRIQKEAETALRCREEELRQEMERRKEELQACARVIEEERLRQIEALELRLKEADGAHEKLKAQLEEHAREEIETVRVERERVEAELKLALDAKQEASEMLRLQLVELEQEQEAKISAAVASAKQDAAQELAHSLKAQHSAELEQLQSILKQQAEEQQVLAEELAQRDKQREELQSELNRRKTDGEKLAESLNCPICCQLFVYAHTLPCSHSFCERCIFQWLAARPQKRECPVCRQVLITDPVPSLVLNQSVQNALTVAGDNAATQEWKDLEKERKAFHEDRKAAAKQKAQATPTPATQNIIRAQIIPSQVLTNALHLGNIAVLPQNLLPPVQVQPQPGQAQPARAPQPRAQTQRTNAAAATNVIVIP